MDNNTLFESLKAYCRNTRGTCKSAFFKKWFTENGKIYTFVFKQNLFVTNIQFRELIDLMQINCEKKLKSDEKKGNAKGCIANITLMNTNDFISMVTGLIETFVNEENRVEYRRIAQAAENTDEEYKLSNDEREIKNSVEQALNDIANEYADFFENIIVVDALYTSCTVSIPHSIEPHIDKICFQSGYINSCGENIYIRNMEKAKYGNLVERLKEYFNIDTNKRTDSDTTGEMQDEKNDPINFIMYTHEDYSIKNKMFINEFQKNGLDDTKFYLSKYYMQDESLVEIVEKLANDDELNKKIKIVKKEDARNPVVKPSENENTDNNSQNAPGEGISEECIWMIIDRSISLTDNKKYPGEKKYYIIYKQLYINENPFHLFDENKPGWLENVTIPHTLIGAMLNIGYAGCLSRDRKIKALDPFIGTGTTLLESIKNPYIELEGADASIITDEIIKINLQFFTLDIDTLISYEYVFLYYIHDKNIQIYEKIVREILFNGNRKLEEYTKKINESSNFIREIYNFIDEKAEEFLAVDKHRDHFFENFKKLRDDFSVKIKRKAKITEIKDHPDLLAGVIICAVWKTYLRNRYKYDSIRKKSKKIEIGNDGIDIIVDSIQEMVGLVYRIEALINLKSRQENFGRSDKKGKKSDVKNDTVSLYIGKYTQALSISDEAIREKINKVPAIIKPDMDVLKTLESYKSPDKKLDMIITDPPYGFNTNESPKEFAELYSSFISSMIECVRDGGQIIMCLPAESYSGKMILEYTRKEMVDRQVKIAAEEQGKKVVEQVIKFPEPHQIYEFPLYWDSEKALRRDIVRYQFFDIGESE